MPDRQKLNADMGVASMGVLVGLEGPLPASGLTQTYSAGLVRTATAPTAQNPLGYIETRIAGSTKTYTVSKDTYAYVSEAGVLTYLEVANGAAKPSQATIGVRSEWIWKVVTDGSNITSVSDLRRFASADIERIRVRSSFVAADLGVDDFQPGYHGRILAIDSSVDIALAGTDAGTVTAFLVNHDNTATAVTNGAVSHAASAAAGVRHLVVPTAVNVFGRGDRIRLTAAKSTSGGGAMVTVVLERLG